LNNPLTDDKLHFNNDERDPSGRFWVGWRTNPQQNDFNKNEILDYTTFKTANTWGQFTILLNISNNAKFLQKDGFVLKSIEAITPRPFYGHTEALQSQAMIYSF
jgi:hypothetical protein